jgi:uncharacterized protein (DUF983 family)
MNWEEWYKWKEKKYIAGILFIIAYILTIPIRDYNFLDEFIDITQGVPIWAHLIIILIGLIVLLVLLKITEMIVKKTILLNR